MKPAAASPSASPGHCPASTLSASRPPSGQRAQGLCRQAAHMSRPVVRFLRHSTSTCTFNLPLFSTPPTQCKHISQSPPLLTLKQPRESERTG